MNSHAMVTAYIFMGVQKRAPKKLQSPTPTLVMHIIYESFLQIFFFYSLILMGDNA